jgi:hypothetical protein
MIFIVGSVSDDEGTALMTAQDIAEGTAPASHSLWVNWFHREPGGSTIFVMPPAADGAATQPVAERGDDATCAG